MAKNEATLEIAAISMGRLTCHLLGTSPLIMHRFSKKAQEQLLFPKGRINSAEKAENLKHDPLTEYRETIYRNRDKNQPAAVHLPSPCFSKALAAAALDIPGASKSQITRLVSITSTQVNLYGAPQMYMTMVRSSDMAKTPDVRTRAIFPEWCCEIEIEYVSTLLKPSQIANLLSAAGIIVGIGDGRPQKGLSFGKFKIVEANNADYIRVMKQQSKVAQLAAIEQPEYYDADTEELFAWFQEEVRRREKNVPSMATAAKTPKPRKETNGGVAAQ